MKKWNRVFYLITLILIIGCESQPMFSVTGENIAQKNINYQLKVEKAYNSEYSDTIGVVFELIQQKWRKKISEDIGIEITDEMLEKEAERINENTKAPEILKRIEKVFKDNREKYINQFVKDVLITRLLQNKFHFDTTYQKEPYSEIQEVYSELKTGDEVDSIVNVFFPEKEKMKRYYRRYLENRISEDKYSYFIVRGSKEKPKVFLVEKNDYTEWFRRKAKKYPVIVYNNEFKEKLLERVKGNKFWEEIIK